MNSDIPSKCKNKNYKHLHVIHDLVCHKNCNLKHHIDKGYSNALINYFTEEELFDLVDNIKEYLILMKDIFIISPTY